MLNDPKHPENEHTTEYLDRILKDTSRRGLGAYLKQNDEMMQDGERPFTAYMRKIIKRNGISQHKMFRVANVSDSYGYKIIAMEKITTDRDLIIQLCLAAKMELEEVNRALKLYEMSPLYAKVPRDAALIIAFNTHMYDINEVDELLTQNGLKPMYRYDKED